MSDEVTAEPSLTLRIAGGLLVVLAAVMPFEAPLFPIGPILVTTVELALYATLLVWGLAVASDLWTGRLRMRAMLGAVRNDWLVQAALWWGAALFVSAASAPSYRAAAVKFTLRSWSGVFAFFATRYLTRSPLVCRRVLFALVSGAVLSAITALVEWLVPSSAPAWRLFREGEFDTLGLTRASGVFGYPTIGAMYWEAAVPLLVVSPFLRARPLRAAGFDRGARLAALASGVLISAVLVSATRSGLAGIAAALVALVALAWRAEVRASQLAIIVLGVLLALWGVALNGSRFGSLLGHRLQWWQDEKWFRVEYAFGAVPQAVQVGQRFDVAVTVRNIGRITWRRAGEHPTHLSYHWEHLDEGPSPRAGGAPPVGEFEGFRTVLPADVPPGATLQVAAVAWGPAVPGAYVLHWDLVQEGVTWFGDQGNRTPEQRLEVTDAFEPVGEPSVELPLPAGTPPPLSRVALWRAAVHLWRERPLLGIGPDNFRRRYEEVVPPAPGGQPYTDTRLHANSMYLEMLADLGLAGVAVLVFIAVALAHLLRMHWRAGRMAGLGFGVAAGTFFVHGASDYFLEFTPLFCLFWLLLGLTAATASDANSP
jgi:hypothetical protein